VERGAGIVDEESASVSSCWRGGSRQYSRGESRPVINSLKRQLEIASVPEMANAKAAGHTGR
jgi:hypothetical protein